MKTTYLKIGMALTLLASLIVGPVFMSAPAEAGRLKRAFNDTQFMPYAARRPIRRLPNNNVELVQDYSDENVDAGQDADVGADVRIRPRQAARIARQAYPGTKVLNVKLLPSGAYAVTLRGDGRLTRVIVDASDGSIN